MEKEELLKLLRAIEEGQADAEVPLAGFTRACAFMRDEPNTIKWSERAADHVNGKPWRLALRPESRRWALSGLTPLTLPHVPSK